MITIKSPMGQTFRRKKIHLGPVSAIWQQHNQLESGMHWWGVLARAMACGRKRGTGHPRMPTSFTRFLLLLARALGLCFKPKAISRNPTNLDVPAIFQLLDLLLTPLPTPHPFSLHFFHSNGSNSPLGFHHSNSFPLHTVQIAFLICTSFWTSSSEPRRLKLPLPGSTSVCHCRSCRKAKGFSGDSRAKKSSGPRRESHKASVALGKYVEFCQVSKQTKYSNWIWLVGLVRLWWGEAKGGKIWRRSDGYKWL